MPTPHKYSRLERERRFLLTGFPHHAKVTQIRRIIDRYIDGTTLRLRQQTDQNGATIFKFTQKVASRAAGAQQGFITNMYLTADEFAILAQLPARLLSKTRYSVPPFGIDVFEGTAQGLVLAEAEFESAAEADTLLLPPFIACEVSDDDRFTGGRLVCASRQELESWLADYGIGI